jgi:hypothetical protein
MKYGATPIFEHDCVKCKFLGSIADKYDMYLHEWENTPHTVLFRYGNEESEYASYPISKEELRDVEAEVRYPSKYVGFSEQEVLVCELLRLKAMNSILFNIFTLAGAKEMKLFYCKGFLGYWPVGTSALVISDSAQMAAAALEIELTRCGLSQRITPDMLVEVEQTKEQVIILNDGDY